jgi:hypothetical protein
MKIVVDPLETLEPLPVEPIEPLPVDEPAGDDPGEALIEEAKQRARRRRLLYAGVAIIVAAVAGTAVSSWSSDAAPPNNATPPVPGPSAVPLGAPLVVGPDAASTLLTSWGQMHVGYVFVYADGRVIWEPDGAPVYADAGGRVTAIPLGGPTATIGRFWLTESGLKPASGTPKGEFGSRNIERRLSAHGLDLVREGKIEGKHLLVQPGESWPAEIPRRPEDLKQWPVAIQLALRSELWAGPFRVWQPSTWAIGFRWQYLYSGELTHPVKQVDATRALKHLPASAQALLTGKRRTCSDTNAGNAHWLFQSTVGVAPGPNVCFELNAAELASFWPILDRNTSISGLTTGVFWPIEVDGRPASLDALPIYPHGQPQVWGG